MRCKVWFKSWLIAWLASASTSCNDGDGMVDVTALAASALSQSSGVAFTQIVADDAHTCGVLADSKHLSCWGMTSLGTEDPPHGVELRSIAPSLWFSCATRAADGGIVCWGFTTLPNLEQATADFNQIAAASIQPTVCAIRSGDGGVECFTYDGKLEGVPSELGFAEVALGDTVACAIKRDDETMRCWDLIDPRVNQPKIHAPPGGFKAVAAAVDFFCAIRTDSNEVVCWGVQPPPDGPPGVAFEDFGITSYGAGCGIRADDHLLQCWGSRVLAAGAPFDMPIKAIAIAGQWGGGPGGAGAMSHGCVLDAENSHVHCWGDDRNAQVSGTPNTTAYLEVVSDLADDYSVPRVCARRADDGHVLCAGLGPHLPNDLSFKQITPWCGIRSDTGRLECSGGTDGVAPPDTTFSHIAQRDGVVCGLRADNGRVTCFGSDAEHIVSDAPKDTLFSQLTVGQTVACGLRMTDGHAECWGSGASYEIPPISLRQIVAPRRQQDQVCGIRSDNNSITCWGSGESYAPTTTPFSRLSEDAGCGLRADTGKAECWSGYGYINLPNWLSFRDLTSHSRGACGIDANDGRLTCWGSNAWNVY